MTLLSPIRSPTITESQIRYITVFSDFQTQVRYSQANNSVASSRVAQFSFVGFSHELWKWHSGDQFQHLLRGHELPKLLKLVLDVIILMVTLLFSSPTKWLSGIIGQWIVQKEDRPDEGSLLWGFRRTLIHLPCDNLLIILELKIFEGLRWLTKSYSLTLILYIITWYQNHVDTITWTWSHDIFY